MKQQIECIYYSAPLLWGVVAVGFGAIALIASHSEEEREKQSTQRPAPSIYCVISDTSQQTGGQCFYALLRCLHL